MAEAEITATEPQAQSRRWWPQSLWAQIALILLALILVGIAIVWFSREQIAGNVIDEALADAELQATYEIESIGAERQVIRNLVIGDPNSPDLTADKVIVNIGLSFGAAELGQIELVRPRLYGSYRDGTFSLTMASSG